MSEVTKHVERSIDGRRIVVTESTVYEETPAGTVKKVRVSKWSRGNDEPNGNKRWLLRLKEHYTVEHRVNAEDFAAMLGEGATVTGVGGKFYAEYIVDDKNRPSSDRIKPKD